MLCDITAHDEISHAFSHCVCRCSVAVFKVCIPVQAGRFYHTRDINVFLVIRRGVENPCTFRVRKISQAALKVITRWWKIKANGMHSFLFQMKLCPQKCLIFADMNLCKFLVSHQIVALSIGLLETHMNKKIVPSSPRHCLILKMWTQVMAEERLNCDSTAEPFCAKTATKDIFWFQSQTRMPMNPNP